LKPGQERKCWLEELSYCLVVVGGSAAAVAATCERYGCNCEPPAAERSLLPLPHGLDDRRTCAESLGA
jgi:hypothetical protein